MLETRSLSAADAKRVEKLVSKHADFEPAKATSSKGQPKLEVSALGDALVWARVEGTDYAGASACFLLTSGAAPRVLATVTSCPPGVRGAGRSPGDVVSVWFDHARARIEKDEITVSYFPTAYFGIAGSP